MKVKETTLYTVRATKGITAYCAVAILNIDGDTVTHAFTDGHTLTDIRTTKVYYTKTGVAYFVKMGVRYAVRDFMVCENVRLPKEEVQW